MLRRLLIIISLCFIFSTPVHAIDGFITITNPNSGTFTEGDTVNITWNSSPNIDKVNIGYKSCPSCLDWVVFTTPNTGSYSWKVDVGNTTNTQFYLQITGYETGKGSLTSNSGTFTVNQNPPLTTGSSSTTTSSSPSPAGSSTSGYPYPSGYRPISTPVPTPTPTPRPSTPIVSIYTLLLYQEFYFEGSMTTNLKDIKDPKKVDNFTLDTQKGFTFIFEETLNLTDQKTLLALQNTKDFWQYEEWYIWIKWEWWIKYDITETINVEYKNDALTAYSPEIITEPNPDPTQVKPKAGPSTRKSPKLLRTEPGKIDIALNDGTPIRIMPKVVLNSPKSPVNYSKITLTGNTSHTNLEWTLNHNGIKSNVIPIINQKSGEFKIEIDDLAEGANTFVVSYKEPGQNVVILEPVTVVYQPSFFGRYGKTLSFLLGGIGAFVLGIIANKYFSKSLKKFSKRKK